MKTASKTVFYGFFLGLLVFLSASFLFMTHPGRMLELKTLDYMFFLRGAVSPPQNLIIVAIDEQSFSELNMPWPWPRRFHAQVIRNLKEAGAKVIAFDVLFADRSSGEDDLALAQSIREAGNVVLPGDVILTEDAGYRQISEIEPVELFRDSAAGVGVCSLMYDADNVIRRSRLRYGKLKTFASETIRLALGNDPALPGDKDILINYIGPARSIKTVSYYQALNYKECLPDGIFKDKVVFIGRTTSASPDPQAKQPDVFPVPRFEMSKPQMSGIEIAANLTDTVLRSRFIKTPRDARVMVLFLFSLILLSLIELKFSYIQNLVFSFFCAAVYGIFVFYCFSYNKLLLPLAMPLAGIFGVYATVNVVKYILAEKEKRYIKSALQKYVPPSLVKQIIDDPGRLMLGGEETQGTVLFSDLEKFTTISEKLAPEALVSFINEYLTAMTDILFKHHGTITRFIGDAILAVWGAPVRMDDHAVRAVKCAVEIRERLEALNNEWEKRGLPRLKIRIGLNSGRMIVGNVGSKVHYDYTAMGDSVNLASRLEDANKYYGVSSIMGEDTYSLVKNSIDCRWLDKVRVKGREEALNIYEPFEKQDEGGVSGRFFKAYESGTQAELGRDWQKAADSYKRALELKHEDIPAKIHFERCERYLVSPPPADWDGAHNLTGKNY